MPLPPSPCIKGFQHHYLTFVGVYIQAELDQMLTVIPIYFRFTQLVTRDRPDVH